MTKPSPEQYEPTVPKQSSPEEKFSGISGLDDIRQQLSAIDAAFQIGEKAKKTWQETPITASRMSPFEITPELCAQFEQEFNEDVRDFHLRVQRLKIRILGHLLAGAWYDLKHGLSYDESEKTPGGKVHSLAWKYKGEKEPLDEAGRKELVGAFNTRLARFL